MLRGNCDYAVSMIKEGQVIESVPGPVTAVERIVPIDTLRGFALLGILVINVTGMAYPLAAYFRPLSYGGSTGLNFAAWVFAHMFFEQKMMGIFSMLFGAGVILMAERAEATQRPFGRIYYRRVFWLLVIGLIHAYLIWYGDILVTYAICGIFLYLFRRRSIRALVISGFIFLFVGALLWTGGGFAQSQLRDAAREIETKVAAGQEMTPRRQGLIDQWRDVRRQLDPTPEETEDTIQTMRGDFAEVLKSNADKAVMMHTQAVPFDLFWRAMALMLFGMALMKADVFSAKRPSAFYRNWTIVGFGLGLPTIAVGIWQMQRHDFDFIARFMVDGHFNYFASVLVSMGYVALIMRLCQSGMLAGFRTRLAAVGRMALSNYLLQSIIGVTVFYGYGFALFGRVGRFNLWWLILAIWVLQLFLSPWWLSRYRFGPAEWLWRSLTYMKWQPMRVAQSTTPTRNT